MQRLSIIIKAYNEEHNIARAIESALEAAQPYGGEVILADGASSDRTVEIAKRYPIVVAELQDPRQRSCGLGPQLGFQHSTGAYVYVLDGDMELVVDFLPKAIDYMEQHPRVAGVGGVVRETRAPNAEFRGRINRLQRAAIDKVIEVDCLNGGGLYRRAALVDVGYLSDRNLHANEEYDLGARLRLHGWRLVRLADRAADHFAHEMGSLEMLYYRVRSGHFLSTGELLRASLEAGYGPMALREVRLLQLAGGVGIYWLLAAVMALASPSVALVGALAVLGQALVVLAISWRHSSLAIGGLSSATWHLAAAGLPFGFLKQRTPPRQRIDSKLTPATGGKPKRVASGSEVLLRQGP